MRESKQSRLEELGHHSLAQQLILRREGEGGGLKEGRKEDWGRRNKKYAKKSNRAQIRMAAG